MTRVFFALVAAVSLSGPATAQAYDQYVKFALNCVAGQAGNAAGQMSCIAEVEKSCREKAGIFEACLEAVEVALVAAQNTAEAQICGQTLDQACPLRVKARAFLSVADEMEQDGWSAVLSQND